MAKAKIMNRLVSICLLLFFVVTGNAQVNNNPKLNELNQDQLNFALMRSKKTTITGIILTFSGLGVAIIGDRIMVDEASKWPGDNYNETRANTGAAMLIIGGATMCIGIPF